MATQPRYTAPSDNNEFAERDSEYVFALVRKHLPEVSLADAEDVAADIFERLLKSRNKETGQTVLQQYSAGYVSAKTGSPVTWRSFLSAKVMLHLRGKRDELSKRNGRELLICDSAAGDGGERWVELFGGRVWDDYPSLNDGEFERRLRDYLAALPGTWEGASLFEVFNEVLERVKSGEKATMVAGLTRKQTAGALARIRELAVEALRAPLRAPVVVTGVELSPAEVRDALDRLRAASGNHVHRALAGHRLMAEGPKGWYHQVSRAELKAYPECALEASAGKVGGAGTGHVKAAVIHALERLLRGLPEAPPPRQEPELPEELTRREILEAELWRITGLDADRIDAIIAAAEKVYA